MNGKTLSRRSRYYVVLSPYLVLSRAVIVSTSSLERVGFSGQYFRIFTPLTNKQKVLLGRLLDILIMPDKLFSSIELNPRDKGMEQD